MIQNIVDRPADHIRPVVGGYYNAHQGDIHRATFVAPLYAWLKYVERWQPSQPKKIRIFKGCNRSLECNRSFSTVKCNRWLDASASSYGRFANCTWVLSRLEQRAHQEPLLRFRRALKGRPTALRRSSRMVVLGLVTLPDLIRSYGPIVRSSSGAHDRSKCSRAMCKARFVKGLVIQTVRLAPLWLAEAGCGVVGRRQ